MERPRPREIGRLAASAACVLAAALALLPPAQAGAEIGDLDPGFGQRGYAEVKGMASAAGVERLADGSVLLLGRARSGVVRVVKLSRSGKADRSWRGGRVPAPPGGPVVGSLHLATDSAGRALVLAASGTTAQIVRFTQDGALDPSFADDGVMLDPRRFTGLAVDGEDRLIAPYDEGLLRFLPDGSPDLSWPGGEAELAAPDIPVNVAVAEPNAANQIMVAATFNFGEERFARVLENGVRDPAFSIVPVTGDRTHAIASTSTGGAYVSRRACYPRNCVNGVIDLLPDGSIGPGFGREFFPSGPLLGIDGQDAAVAGGDVRFGYRYADNTAIFSRSAPPGPIDARFGLDGHAYLYPKGRSAFATAIDVAEDGGTVIGTSPSGGSSSESVLVAALRAGGRRADADADGVLDQADRCPALPGAGASRSGCDRLPRKLRMRRRGDRLAGRLAGARACTANERVKILRLKRSGRRTRVAMVETAYPRGSWELDRSLRPGRYVAVAAGTWGHGVGICPRVESKARTIR